MSKAFLYEDTEAQHFKEFTHGQVVSKLWLFKSTIKTQIIFAAGVFLLLNKTRTGEGPKSISSWHIEVRMCSPKP